jgi:hypothetical protein
MNRPGDLEMSLLPSATGRISQLSASGLNSRIHASGAMFSDIREENLRRVRQESQGLVFIAAMGLFAAGFVLESVWGFYFPSVFETSQWVVYALSQTVGLIWATCADVNVDRFLHHHSHWVAWFAALWLGNTALAAAKFHVLWIQALPVVYLALRFKPIVHMHEGHMKATQWLMFVLMTNLVAYGAWYLTNPYMMEPYWPQVVLGLSEALGVIPMYIAYNTGVGRDQKNATVKLYMSMYAYLMSLGVVILMQCLFAKFISNVHYASGMWLFGPIHILPTAFMVIYRKTIHKVSAADPPSPSFPPLVSQLFLSLRCPTRFSYSVGHFFVFVRSHFFMCAHVCVCVCVCVCGCGCVLSYSTSARSGYRNGF